MYFISLGEMFSNIYKIRYIVNSLCLEVEGKVVSRTEGTTTVSLVGRIAFAGDPEDEGRDATINAGVDIVINHDLQEIGFTKKSYQKFIKNSMQSKLWLDGSLGLL
uniref:Translationally-controlled tumor protein n=1 Tax=Sarcophilus harrisii TaxID=9305 RepID=G3WEU9_SARHA